MKFAALKRISLLLSTVLVVSSISAPVYAEPVVTAEEATVTEESEAEAEAAVAEESEAEEEAAVTEESEAEAEATVTEDLKAAAEDAIADFFDGSDENYHVNGRIHVPNQKEADSLGNYADDASIQETSEKIGENLPAKYITPINYLTRLKDQGVWGTCWAHASIAAVESRGIMKGLFDRNINLSELAMVRYRLNGKKMDRFGNTSGDSETLLQNLVDPLDKTVTPYDGYLNIGGFQFTSINLLMSWVGPSYDSGDFDYETTNYRASRALAGQSNSYYAPFVDLLKSENPKDVQKGLALSTKGKDAIYQYIDYAHTNRLSYLLDENHDSMAYTKDACHVMGYKYASLQDYAQRGAVKQLIKDYGMVDIGVYSGYASNGNSLYVSENNCYYQNEFSIDDANHEVNLVGWDDNFAKEKFDNGSGNIPPDDGAWLVRNTWTTDESIMNDDPSVPNSSVLNESGYFWISYYDTSIDAGYAYDVEPFDNYDYIYQYDGGSLNASHYGKDTISAANVFKVVGEDQILKAASFQTTTSNVKATVEIYLNPTDSSDPTSGTKVEEATTSISASYPGGYTIPLNSYVNVEKNSTYAVVITVQKKGYKPDIIGEVNYEYADSGIDYHVAVNRGDSFIYDQDQNKSQWTDVIDIKYPYDESDQEDIDKGLKCYYGNLRIKAYTDKTSDTPFIKYIIPDGVNNSENPHTVPAANYTLKAPTLADAYNEFRGWYRMVGGNAETITEIPSDGSVMTVYAKTKMNNQKVADDQYASTDDTLKIEAIKNGKKTVYTVTPDLQRNHYLTVIKGNKIAISANAVPGGIQISKKKKCTYQSDNKKIATVNNNGLITAKNAGETQIRYYSGNEIRIITVRVVAPGIVSPLSGTKAKTTATVRVGQDFAVCTNLPLNYDSSGIVIKNGKATSPVANDVAVCVNEDGLVTITGKTVKKGKIIATIPVNGKKVSMKITVK